jgi:hypothetical protein
LVAQSALSLNFMDLRREAGKFLGYGADPANYSVAETADLAGLIDSAYRTVLFPPVLPGEAVPHRWSFLRPLATFTTVGGTEDYDLPDEFEGFAGPIRSADQSFYAEIQITSVDNILALRQALSGGLPSLAAIKPRYTNGQTTGRWTLMLWPNPAGAYGLTYRYNLAPRPISEAEPYPLGGVGFGEMLMEAVLSLCEERKDDAPGIHRQKFLERLVSEIQHDRATIAPDTFGYFGDPSTQRNRGWEPHEYAGLVTYNGVP